MSLTSCCPRSSLNHWSYNESVHDGTVDNFCLTDEDCLKHKDHEGYPVRVRKANQDDVSFDSCSFPGAAFLCFAMLF